MNERGARYNKARRIIRRNALQGDPTAKRLYAVIREGEQRGDSEEEVIAALLAEISAMLEQETGMTFDDYLWLASYAPPEKGEEN